MKRIYIKKHIKSLKELNVNAKRTKANPNREINLSGRLATMTALGSTLTVTRRSSSTISRTTTSAQDTTCKNKHQVSALKLQVHSYHRKSRSSIKGKPTFAWSSGAYPQAFFWTLRQQLHLSLAQQKSDRSCDTEPPKHHKSPQTAQRQSHEVPCAPVHKIKLNIQHLNDGDKARSKQ